ncbi:hypothetical protein [Sporosarcina gallistercoris]|uniref:Lipoprotein n=1 Tax=Sporosarcina gallistercoris TaxID=2762245 RepID=A0ABR8PJ36_9BACL|nr:hypothetical protein [Sporosarcina gallistercoris]MBD7908201.1 hypothetical protein [Sporosarcina gallistercoris]
MKRILIMGVILGLLSSGCSAVNVFRGCPDGIIEWADVVKLNDVKYAGDIEGISEDHALEKGSKVGEVNYMMADHACSNHKIRNGDATYLPVGTEVYEAVGYRSDFRVIAEDRVFQVRDNEAADTIGDLYDIEGKVIGIILESEIDNSYLAELNEEQIKSFVEDYLSLEYIGYDKVSDEIEGNNRVFLRIHLQDGSSFLESYWLDSNILTTGAYGTERMSMIIEKILEK